MKALIGIDVGTSGTKTLIIDVSGKVLAGSTREYPSYAPRPLWSEQDPADWWKATCASIREVLGKSGVRAKDVAGVGLSGQMHGSVFLDARGGILRRAILWNDQRTAAECAEIYDAVGGRRRLIALVSNPALTGFTAPKILWTRRHEPGVYRKIRKILLPKDYIRYRLTGVYATEVSDASGTLLLDVKRRRWCGRLLDALDIDGEFLPEVFESHVPSGRISPEAAKATGLLAGTPVVGGGGDQAAGAVGNGIVRRGVISATMGTSGVVFAHSDRVQTDPEGRVHTFCHAVDGKWHVMGVVLSAGGSFQWFRNNLGAEERAEAKRKRVDPYELLTAKAAGAPAGSEGLIFLPYLTGERTPHADPLARGAFVGLTPRHGKGHMVRSVLEGATFAMRDSLEIVKSMGVPVRQIRVSGGGARSGLWRQIQADIYGMSVVTINASEGPAYGVALLAGVGAGIYRNVAQATDDAIRITGRTDPIAKNVKIYDEYYEIYRSLYGALKESFASIARAVR